MKNNKQNRLRAQVQKIEEKIIAITGDNVEYNMEWTRSQRKCEQVERLIWKRKHLLDKMFVATPEEVVRMEQVNNRLYDLTQKMYARTEALYRKMATSTYDPEFDDDVEIEGSLRFSPNGRILYRIHHIGFRQICLHGVFRTVFTTFGSERTFKILCHGDNFIILYHLFEFHLTA